jgi:hypothetical protein
MKKKMGWRGMLVILAIMILVYQPGTDMVTMF